MNGFRGQTWLFWAKRNVCYRLSCAFRIWQLSVGKEGGDVGLAVSDNRHRRVHRLDRAAGPGVDHHTKCY